MYKVFIENKPLIFQINSQVLTDLNIDQLWQDVASFLCSDEAEMVISIHKEADFLKFFKNHKYIEAAGGMVQRDDSFLFIKRNDVWDIPKGKLDPGETPEIAAVREIEEECGLLAPKIKDHLIDTWHTYVHKGKNVLKRTYWYWLYEGDQKTELIPQAEEGITDVAYFKLAELEPIMANTYLSIIEVVDELKKRF
ncbi:MAG: 8-oxo-dGTP pyrophosphatase MutT (NUDIX family) [Crocinitomix sp.]|jgi:8-oxo-dGTP pyrophosphatase MutT (NUDIX family)